MFDCSGVDSNSSTGNILLHCQAIQRLKRTKRSRLESVSGTGRSQVFGTEGKAQHHLVEVFLSTRVESRQFNQTKTKNLEANSEDI